MNDDKKMTVREVRIVLLEMLLNGETGPHVEAMKQRLVEAKERNGRRFSGRAPLDVLLAKNKSKKSRSPAVTISLLSTDVGAVDGDKVRVTREPGKITLTLEPRAANGQ